MLSSQFLKKCALWSVLCIMAFPAYVYAEDAEEEEENEVKKAVDFSSMTPAEREAMKLENLITSLNSTDYQHVERSVYELTRMINKAIPLLIQTINDEDADMKQRINAIYALGRMGRKAKKSLPTIVRMSRSDDPDMRAVSAKAMGKIRMDQYDTVPALRKLLKDDVKWVRKSAEEALRAIGSSKAKQALKEASAAL